MTNIKKIGEKYTKKKRFKENCLKNLEKYIKIIQKNLKS